MKLRVLISTITIAVLLGVSSTASTPMAPAAPAAPAFDKAEYAARRTKLMAEIGNGAAIFLGATTPASDVTFRQGHDFFYMTGLELPDAMLIVDGARKESVLFFTIDEHTADGAGIPLALVRTPVEYSGIERAMPVEQFGSQLAGFVNRKQPLYTVFKPEEIGPENSNEKFNALQKSMTMNVWDGRLTRELQFVKQLRERFPQADVRDATSIVWTMRKYKSKAEIDIMRRVAQLGVKAHKEFIQSTRPGVSEKSLAAVFDFVSANGGGRGLAYYTIIMSGRNHEWGHYHQYDRVLEDGDFLILDAAPDLENYHVDISTSFPASGTFSPRQKELYEVALAVHDVALQNYRPGVTLRQVGQKVDALIKERGWEQYAQDFAGIVRLGGYNHLIGLGTHDVAGMFGGADEVLKPGFVFACDIQLFRRDEEIGIRIEDTVAITDTGYEVLSLGVPRTVAEIEALMKQDGMLQILKKNGRLDPP